MDQDQRAPLTGNLVGQWLLWTRKFSFGTAASLLATSIIQPIDTVKVRIQVNSEQLALGNKNVSISPFKVASNILKNEGAAGFYNGIGSAWLRQIVYGTARLGLYKVFFEMIQQRKGGDQPNLAEKAICSLSAGALGSFIGNPTDLCLVRFQSDSLLPKDQRRNYKNVFDALQRIAREEGVATLWRGSVPTMARAASMNLGMLATYDQMKETLCALAGREPTDTTMPIRMGSSLSAGFMAAACCLPFDNCKTKLQKMKMDPKTGKLPYKNLIDVFFKTVTQEGPFKLWVGFPTFYARVGTHAMTTLLTMDFLLRYAEQNWKGVYFH